MLDKLLFFSVYIKLDISIRRSVNLANKEFNYIGDLKYLKYLKCFVLSKLMQTQVNVKRNVDM